jgi:methyl-accepting chemotaxis protein
MRNQSQQTAKSLAEQATSVKDMAASAALTLKQVRLISRANSEHTTAAQAIAGQLSEIRRITDQNVAGVAQTRGSTTDLVAQAEALKGLMANATKRRNGSHGRDRRSAGR